MSGFDSPVVRPARALVLQMVLWVVVIHLGVTAAGNLGDGAVYVFGLPIAGVGVVRLVQNWRRYTVG